MTVSVEEVAAPTGDVLASLRRLLPQLSQTAAPLEADELADLCSSAASILLVARDDDGGIVGSLTLAVFRVPTGVRAWIEDVVVDEAARGQGVGAALVEAAVTRAAEAGARSVDLTSRPSREAANRLYRRLGFEVRQTNVYRLDVTR